MRQEAKNWWLQAAKDFDAAKYNLKGNRFYLAAFMCQQSVEKAIKALIIQRTEDFPKIHDLTKLAKMVNAPLEMLELCAKINPAYIASRYPDTAKKYSKKECNELLKYAKKVLEWIKKNLK